jgi:alcohol dehydrogenase
MKALVLQKGRICLESAYPEPVPLAGEGVIKVRLAGICSTDLELLAGYMEFSGVPGHEFVGTVESSGRPELLGKRVVGEINCACGVCSECTAGRSTHCPKRTVLGILRRDGALAEKLSLPEKNLHAVPDAISDEEAVFVEPVAAALEILEQVHVRPTQTVYVIGDGKLGLIASQVLRLTGCRLTSIGKHPRKLNLLQTQGMRTARLDQAPSERADIVVECTGNRSGFELARSLVRPRGVLVLKSTFKEEGGIETTPLVIEEITIVGSRCGPFPPAISLLEQKLIDVKSLITAAFPLSRGLQAFEKASEPESLKVLLRME